MKSIKQQLLLALTICLFASCNTKEKKKIQEKPNILFLFADDYTYEAIHALGNSVIKTPNLDKLVNNGTTFTHAYNMGGWEQAVCVASRSMIISGRSLWRAQEMERKWIQNDSIANNNTWGQLMQAQGYNTYMSGKWHVRVPANKVFETAKDIKPGMPSDNMGKNWGPITKAMREAYEKGEDVAQHLPSGYNRPLDENDHSWSPTDTLQGGFWQGGKHWSEVLKDHSLEFIADAVRKEDPFFMYVAFNAPHDPRQSPQSFLDKYNLNDIPLPKNWLPEYPYKESIGNSVLVRDEALAPYPRTSFAIKTHLKEYYAIITHLDEQIGKIFDALEASGKADNTYIFFTGDHGLSVGHHGLIGKQSLFDHSVRVPLMVTGPGIPKGKKLSNDVYLQDIMATSLELAGIEKPDYVDFNSLLPLAKGETAEGSLEKGVYGAYMDYQRMIRKDGYKLLVYPKIDKVLLFDMENDPLEMHDLAEEPEHKERVKTLFASLLELQKEMKDPLDLNEMYQNLF
ncbi:sulfatase-like hydrolase/transferase [Flagellimonas onchidii]|uniref:sulfatase-like hydrolase/transferase n=1 Tax=Flagellimonas onchidii TaxID=2562684 RepID=UPI0010A690EE|nr:sulfatase-like hydrolase/transferase [Allomuricauda onchidii]